MRRGRRAGWVGLLATTCLVAAVGACEHQEGAGPRRKGQEAGSEFVRPAATMPEYTFEETCRRQYPEIVDFLEQFLETCLAGDYGGYRRLCSRLREPETRERFEAVYHAIHSLHVDSIETVELSGLPEPVYRVVCTADFHPESRARLRRKSNRVAVLVVQEQGQWRILPAPAEWQPDRDEPAERMPASAPTSVPSYPWDRDDGE
jgi:hypothetical protein